ncbi:hypothetical protein ACIRG5_15145 [Lentzea sp. NPDC102401]|uniref:DUF7919 family protein n=1 Tax=Lentzea sp. NPDC102401 TaxID=3364128 RepID=UPI003825ECA1
MEADAKMTYYPDLSPYEYFKSDEKMLNVGWLDAGHDFPRGPLAPEFVDALLELNEDVQNQTRGLHWCVFCKGAFEDVPNPHRSSGGAAVGSAEIHAVGADGVRYSAPTLVIHYVTEHEYQPPEAFVAAVLYTADVKL